MMASPHAAGVAALIKQLHPGWSQGAVAAAVRRSATQLACPTNWPASDPRRCYGGLGNTSFFGKGSVNADAAVKQ
jgi:lantibiotic leader peptide-processing serine protease